MWPGCRWHQKWNLTALSDPPPFCTDMVSGIFEGLFADMECAL
jgi:hypothetical protein